MLFVDHASEQSYVRIIHCEHLQQIFVSI